MYGGARHLPKQPNPITGVAIDKTFPDLAPARGMTCGGPVPPTHLHVEAKGDQVCVTVDGADYLDTGGLKVRPTFDDIQYSIFVDRVQSAPQAFTPTSEPRLVTRCDTREGIRKNVWSISSRGCFATPRLTSSSTLLAVYQSYQELGAWDIGPAGAPPPAP
jgi:hypothetical protein